MRSSTTDYENRGRIFILIIVGVIFIFIVRLAYLQLFSEEYDKYADSNALFKKTIYPERGVIYDRNGKLMVYNQAFYDIMVTPREMQGLDTLEFCSTLKIDRAFFEKRMTDIRNRRLNPGYSSYTPQLFMSQLSVEAYGPLQEKLYRFPGFSITNRSLRRYSRPIASHALGYVAEVNRKDIEEDNYYTLGDYSGRSGIEKMYENVLRGEKGVEVLLRDVHGRIKGSYNEGKRDLAPVPGKDLTLSLDMDLQEYGEKLMENKRGAIVAIEPKTGEILVYVSAPSYDPSLLVGSTWVQHYMELESSPHKIFLNRPIQSFYPPGSTLKPAQGLIFLQENIISPSTKFACYGGYFFARQKLGCHSHPSPLNLPDAISASCNAYFAAAYRSMIDHPQYSSVQEAYEQWRRLICSIGFGSRLGVDLPYEQSGLIPTTDYYNGIYGQRGWRGATIISNGIGQGEVLATPLQMANYCAVICNKGWYITPHIVRQIHGMEADTSIIKKHVSGIDPEHFEPIIEGMRGAVTSPMGTSKGVSIPGIEVCGKTGTAENPGVDHSIFICFAPKDDPQICMLVFIENGGFGATWAVPMASLMLEKYLKGSIAPGRKWMETRLLNANLMNVELKD